MLSSSERKSPRVSVNLDVFIQTVDGDVPCQTRDASYHGVFIVRRDPLPLRKLIRFRTRIPGSDEDLQMLGLVAHTVNATEASEHKRDPGMGIQLFSLGRQTRQRWREYVDSLYQDHPEASHSIDLSARPTVQVRIPNSAILRKFRSVDLPGGSIFVQTPDVHDVGTHVDCVIVHPLTEMKFAIPARVTEKKGGSADQRGVRLDLDVPEDTTKLEAFLDGRVPSHSTAPPPAPDDEA